MTLSGWILLVLAWGLILGLCGFCFARVFGLKRTNLEAPLDIDTEKPVRRRPAGKVTTTGRKRGKR